MIIERQHAISRSRGRSIPEHLSYGDTGKLGRNFRVASTRGQSLRIARKTDARDCIMCLHECTRVSAWYDARRGAAIPCHDWLLTRETAPWLRCRFATSKCFQNEKKPETRPSEIPDRSIYRTRGMKQFQRLIKPIFINLNKSYPSRTHNSRITRVT